MPTRDGPRPRPVLDWRRRHELPIVKMLNRQRMALNPAALEANRAGTITRGQRFQLSARATGAALGLVSKTLFSAIAWWLVVKGGMPWMALPGLIAAIVAPIALWAL